MLIDPTSEDPWQHLDFDPDTGDLTARFEVEANDWSAKGAKTVEVLRLDRREALGNVYKTTFKRLSRIVRTWLDADEIEVAAMLAELQQADDHGLLPWCFGPSGQTVAPFLTLREKAPAVWSACRRAVR